MQAGIEPLRAVGSTDLQRQHRSHLVVIDFCVGFCVEIVVFKRPIRPAPSKPVKDLP